MAKTATSDAADKITTAKEKTAKKPAAKKTAAKKTTKKTTKGVKKAKKNLVIVESPRLWAMCATCLKASLV